MAICRLRAAARYDMLLPCRAAMLRACHDISLMSFSLRLRAADVFSAVLMRRRLCFARLLHAIRCCYKSRPRYYQRDQRHWHRFHAYAMLMLRCSAERHAAVSAYAIRCQPLFTRHAAAAMLLAVAALRFAMLMPFAVTPYHAYAYAQSAR